MNPGGGTLGKQIEAMGMSVLSPVADCSFIL